MHTRPEQYRPFSGGYISEFEQFMHTYEQQHPALAEDRQRGMAIWWDRRVDFDALERQRQDSIPVKPYDN